MSKDVLTFRGHKPKWDLFVEVVKKQRKQVWESLEPILDEEIRRSKEGEWTMAESRIIKARIDKEYQAKFRMILNKYQIDPAEQGADSMGLRIAIDLALSRLHDIPTDVVNHAYKIVSQAHHLRKKTRKRKPRKSIYNVNPNQMDADDFGEWLKKRGFCGTP